MKRTEEVRKKEWKKVARRKRTEREKKKEENVTVGRNELKEKR